MGSSLEDLDRASIPSCLWTRLCSLAHLVFSTRLRWTSTFQLLQWNIQTIFACSVFEYMALTIFVISFADLVQIKQRIFEIDHMSVNSIFPNLMSGSPENITKKWKPDVTFEHKTNYKNSSFSGLSESQWLVKFWVFEYYWEEVSTLLFIHLVNWTASSFSLHYLILPVWLFRKRGLFQT